MRPLRDATVVLFWSVMAIIVVLVVIAFLAGTANAADLHSVPGTAVLWFTEEVK